MVTETMVLTEENRNELLNFSILTRKTFIDVLVKETLVEENLTIDKDTSSFLTKLLDGMDKTIISIDKRNNERSSNKTKEETNALIANVLLKISEKTTKSTNKLELDETIKPLHIVDGELDINAPVLTYETFILNN